MVLFSLSRGKEGGEQAQDKQQVSVKLDFGLKMQKSRLLGPNGAFLKNDKIKNNFYLFDQLICFIGTELVWFYQV